MSVYLYLKKRDIFIQCYPENNQDIEIIQGKSLNKYNEKIIKEKESSTIDTNKYTILHTLKSNIK